MSEANSSSHSYNTRYSSTIATSASTSTSTNPVPRRKGRPFHAPKTAAVKARMQHNATSSLLFKGIPAEVRRRIFTHVIGNHTVLIRHRDNPDPNIRKPIIYGDRSTDFLNLLRVCRAIYSEAHPLFWSENTFSFNDPTAFKYWMEARITHERRLTRSIKLQLTLTNHLAMVGGLPKVWQAVLSARVIESLLGLRDFSAIINHVKYIHPGLLPEREHPLDYLFKGTTDLLLGFKVLPLKKVRLWVVNTIMHKVRVGPGKWEWVVRETKNMKRKAKLLRQEILGIRRVGVQGE